MSREFVEEFLVDRGYVSAIGFKRYSCRACKNITIYDNCLINAPFTVCPAYRHYEINHPAILKLWEVFQDVREELL